MIRSLPDGYPGPITLASGKAEHFLPPEPPRVIAKRAASSRAERARRKGPMIISQFWLPVRWVLKSPSHAFEVMVTNLEAAELRFRFRFVATQSLDGNECTQTLRDHVEPLGNQRSGPASLLARQPWTRIGRFYATRWEFPIGPGETQRSGLAARLPLNTGGMFTPDVFEPDGAASFPISSRNYQIKDRRRAVRGELPDSGQRRRHPEAGDDPTSTASWWPRGRARA